MSNLIIIEKLHLGLQDVVRQAGKESILLLLSPEAWHEYQHHDEHFQRRRPGDGNKRKFRLQMRPGFVHAKRIERADRAEENG